MVALQQTKNVKMNMELRDKIESALAEIRPFLVQDGGDVGLVSFTETKVEIKFLGACTDCAVNKMTLTNGVEATIKRFAPQIEHVVLVS